MSSGFNAIDAAHHVMGRLRELELCWNEEKGDHPYFEDLDHPIEAVGERAGFYAQGYVLPEGTDAENALRRVHETVFEDELRTFTTPGYLDGRVYALYQGIPALVYGPISEAIHGYDERVDIESVRRITKSIALFIAQWCGLTEVS